MYSTEGIWLFAGHAGQSMHERMRPQRLPAVSFLRWPVHGALDDVVAAVALPPVAAVEVDLVMHGVVDGDGVAAARALRSKQANAGTRAGLLADGTKQCRGSQDRRAEHDMAGVCG